MLGAPDGATIIETSTSNHQWQYVMADGTTRTRTGRCACVGARWKSDGTAPSNLIRPADGHQRQDGPGGTSRSPGW